jgi:hypothetical protein
MNQKEFKIDVMSGLSQRDLAYKYDVTHSAIQYWLKKLDIKTSCNKRPHNYDYNRENMKIKLQELTQLPLTMKQISMKLNLTLTKTRYWLNYFNLKTNTPPRLTDVGKKMICKNCNNKFILDFKKGHTKHLCGKCRTLQQKQSKKHKLIKLFGGKCTSCGYNKCQDCLIFHHQNDNKSFKIASQRNSKMSTLIKEANKCELLCTRCHNIIHHNNQITLKRIEYIKNPWTSQIKDRCIICHKLQKHLRKRLCNGCRISIKRWKTKLFALEYLGNKCVICYYDNILDLVFHHKDIRIKEFEISKSTDKSIEQIKKELDKCLLICSRCHGEVHAGVAKCV